MISKQFKVLIEQFKKENEKYGTQDGALYQCRDATSDFLLFANRYHQSLVTQLDMKCFEFTIKSSIGLCPKIYKSGENEMGKRRADWHSVVSTKHFLIDWTARQYVATAPFPLILAKRNLHIRCIDIDGYDVIRLSHPEAVGLREDVHDKRQRGYIWNEIEGWQAPMPLAAAAGHGG